MLRSFPPLSGQVSAIDANYRTKLITQFDGKACKLACVFGLLVYGLGFNCSSELLLRDIIDPEPLIPKPSYTGLWSTIL